ncbi:phosphatidate cytidylyltransferase, partial [Rhizobium ruizarguesonis]
MTSMFSLVLAAILGLLAVASAIGFTLQRRATEPGSVATVQNLNARIRSWWIMVAVFGGAILLGETSTVVLFAFLSFMALREFWTLTPSRRGDHLALFLSFFVV